MARVTIQEYTRNLLSAIRELEQDRKIEGVRIAADALALAKRRVINTGETASGGQFSDYSAPYARIREERGRQTSFKNFSFTGDMMKTIEPQVVEETEESITLVFGSANDLDQQKYIWNSEREGQDILGLSEDEKDLLSDLNRERIENTLKRYGIGT